MPDKDCFAILVNLQVALHLYIQLSTLENCFSLDVKQEGSSWQNENAMNQKRKHFDMVTLGNAIYAVGGYWYDGGEKFYLYRNISVF